LWLAWIIATAVLIALGIFDRYRGYNETPLASYVFVAVLPTLLSACAVQFMAREDWPGMLVIAVLSLLSFLAAFPAILLGIVVADATGWF